MKKSIYLLTFIFLIGYNLPVKSALTNALKKMQNYGRRFTNKLKGFIPKKHYTKKSSSYDYKKEQRKIKIWEAKQKAAPYIEKFSNLIHGYGYKSDTDILRDTFKGDKVKNIEYLLSKHDSWKIASVPELGYLTLIEAAVWTKNFKIVNYLLKQKRVFLDDRIHHFYLGEEPKTLSVNLDIPNALTKGLRRLREHWFDKKYSGLTFYPNDLEVIKFLLDHGVDINQAHEKLGETALMWAAKYGEKDLVKFLLEKGADINKYGNIKINSKNIHNATAEYIAEKSGHPEIAELIAKFRDQRKDTFLQAITNGQKDLVESLLKKDPKLIDQGFDIKIGDEGVYAHPELVAKQNGQPEIAKLISKIRSEQEAKERQERQQLIKD